MKKVIFAALSLAMVAASTGVAVGRGSGTSPVVHGKLRPATHAPIPGWDTSKLPRWQLTVGGKTYYLELRGSVDLDKLADKLQKAWYVRVTGRTQMLDYGLSRLPGPKGGPVTDDGLVVKLPVIVVESMRESELEAAPMKMEFRGKLAWTGNYYFQLEGGGIAGTLKGCEWEGYLLHTSQGTYRLLLDGGAGELYLRGWGGKGAVVVGRVETRVLPGWLSHRPYVADVMIVEDIRVE